MTDRDPRAPTTDGEVSTPPRRYPAWTDPPLPGGPIEPTPPGSATMESRGGATSAQLVRTGHRVPILYGRLYFSPDIVRVQQISDTPKLYGVISEGPIEEIESITGGVDAGDYLVTSLGSLTPTAAIGTWSIGLACFVGYKIDGPSPVYVMAKGRKPYDPRITGASWGAGEYPDEDFCVYSTNPALIMADLLCFPQYGLDGVLPSAVDWATVEAAADWCDELISSVKRYEIGGLRVAEAGTNRDWMNTVGLHAGLRWREVAGLWYLDFDDGAATSEATVTEGYLIEGSRPSVKYGAGSGLSGQPNRFTAEWTRVSGGGYTVETAVVTVTHASVNAGAAIRESSVYRLHGCQNEAQAKRALERIAAEIWSEVEIDLSLTLDFLHLGIGSRFTTNLPSLGLIGVDWRVTRIAYDADSVRLTAKLYAGDTWTAADEEDLASPSPVGADDPLQGYLPSPPPPAPSAAPTAPSVLAPPSLGLVPLYRAIAEDPPPADGEVAVWDFATRTVRFEAGGPGGGSPLSVQEQPPPEGDTFPVTDVTLIMVEGATVTEVSPGVAKIAVPAPSPGVTDHGDLTGRSDASSHPASAVAFTPPASMAATNVQAAIEEIAEGTIMLGQAIPLIATPSGGAFLPVDSVVVRASYPALSAKFPTGPGPYCEAMPMFVAGDRAHGGASNGGTIVVARFASSNHVLVSFDGGASWQTAPLPITSSGWRGLVYGNGVFVMAQYASTSGFISSDGATWSTTTLPSAANWNGAVFGGGVFVMLPNGGNVCARSTNGTTWTSGTFPSSGAWNLGLWDATRSRFFVHMTNAASGAYSSNGTTWTAATGGLSACTTGHVFASGRYIVVGSTSSYATSDDGGASWTSRTLPIATAGAWRTLSVGTDTLLLVQDGSAHGLATTDGINWTDFYLPYAAAVWAVRMTVPGKPYAILSSAAELGAMVRAYPVVSDGAKLLLRGPIGYHVRVS